jgi:hypothetical protein
MKVSELNTELDGKFTAVDERITAEGERVRRYVDERITAEGETFRRYVDERLTAEGETFRRYVDERVTAEGETTRRHFDVVAEKMLSERNLGLDRSMATAQQLAGLTASNAADHVRLERRLDDHERRIDTIDTIERGRATDPV